VPPWPIIRAVSAASPSLPSGSWIEPTSNIRRTDTRGEVELGSVTTSKDGFWAVV
jgi:hypothetical protein